MHMKLDQPVRELVIRHGYYSDAYMRRRLEGQPLRLRVFMPAPKPADTFDWRKGFSPDEPLDLPEFLQEPPQ